MSLLTSFAEFKFSFSSMTTSVSESTSFYPNVASTAAQPTFFDQITIVIPKEFSKFSAKIGFGSVFVNFCLPLIKRFLYSVDGAVLAHEVQNRGPDKKSDHVLGSFSSVVKVRRPTVL